MVRPLLPPISRVPYWAVLTDDLHHLDDVLKARLKTTGVVEHTFTMSKQSDFKGVDWKIYDVGGARPQRHAWAPYFDDGELSHLTPYSCPRPTTRPNPPFSWFYDPSSSQLITPPTSQSTQSSS